MRHAVTLVVVLCLAVGSLSAATFVAPSDAALLGRAELVVVGTVVGTSTRETADRMIYTDSRLRVEDVLKGHFTDELVTVSELGGIANGHGIVVPGTAKYPEGARVMAFLRQREDGSWFTAYMALGEYRFEKRNGLDLLVRDSDGLDVDDQRAFAARPAREFLDYIRDGAPATRRPMQIETEAVPDLHPVTEASAESYVMVDGKPLRWNCPSACTKNWTVGAPQQGSVNTPEAVQDAMAAWSNDPNAWISLGISGLNNHTAHTNDDINDIIFNSNDTAGICDAGVGCGIIYHNAQAHSFDGGTNNFYSIVSTDVIIRPVNFTQNAFEGVLTHELGHGLGFKHAPSSGAIMSATPPSGASLRAYDHEAVSEVYGNGAPCGAPVINSTSGTDTIYSGENKQLSVSASGTPPFTYQWYRGTSGDTSNPVGTNSASYTTPDLTQTTTYWVRVSSCSPAQSTNSGNIVVTVEECPTPAITAQPQNKNIAPNTTATLTVAASNGSPFDYQWYRGTSGDTANPVGTNSPTFTTPPLTETTSYWVKVTNTCDLVKISNTAVVEVQACPKPSFTTQPENPTIQPNTTTTLTVATASNTTVIYQWYRGVVGDVTTPVGGNFSSFTTPALTQSTSYWVRATNTCGATDSAQATVTVGATCATLGLAPLPTNVEVLLGQGTTLNVTPLGTGPFTFQWFAGESPSTSTPVAGATSSSLALGPYEVAGTHRYWVRVTDNCNNSFNGATIVVTVGCNTPTAPKIAAPSIAHYTSGYVVKWTGNLSLSSTFQLQEALDASFTVGLKTFTVNGLEHPIDAHSEVTTDTRFYYRVRAIGNCNQTPTAYSTTTTTVVTVPEPADSSEFSISVPQEASQTFVQPYLVPGFGEEGTSGDTFTVTDDVPWLSVFPSSGALSQGGTTIEFTIDPSQLGVGSTAGTVVVTRTQGSTAKHGPAVNATTSLTLPFNVSKVTPVSPEPRGANAPPGTLVVPAIAHAAGIGTRFQSDVRIVNASGQPINYLLSYTPSQTNGTEQGKQLPITIEANETKGLDDIVKAWFGSGILGEPGLGTLEIRPLDGASPTATFASSRTYAIDSTTVSDIADCSIARCTLGQFIPALGLDKFITNIANDSRNVISLQQLSNSLDTSSGFRTNLGFVEGAGEQVTMRLTLRDSFNAAIGSHELTLPPYGHMQTSLAAVFGATALSDGRVEVEVISPSGKVSGYASVVDNETADPLLVFPVQAKRVAAQHYVLPGVADLDNGAASNFHTDMRLYNAGASQITTTLNYYPQAGDSTPRPAAVNITLLPGEVKALDNVLPQLFQLTRTGGAVTVDAPADSSVVVTGRTFSRNSEGGTYGQFIPGVTSADAVGFGERALEVLQLEQSDQYRTNLGLVEVTGNPVTIEVLGQTGAKITARTEITLSGNEFRQVGRVFEQLGISGSSYTGRVSVKVIGGNGRIAAYGSVVDNKTVDPTYIFAQ